MTLGANAPVLGEHLLGHGQAGDSLGSPRFVLWSSGGFHLIALAAETKVAAKEFLNSLISPQNSRNFPAFTCFPCLICCKTGACRDVAVSFHIMLGYGTETRMQYVFEIGLRHTHLFNMCGKDTMF